MEYVEKYVSDNDTMIRVTSRATGTDPLKLWLLRAMLLALFFVPFIPILNYLEMFGLLGLVRSLGLCYIAVVEPGYRSFKAMETFNRQQVQSLRKLMSYWLMLISVYVILLPFRLIDLYLVQSIVELIFALYVEMITLWKYWLAEELFEYTWKRLLRTIMDRYDSPQSAGKH